MGNQQTSTIDKFRDYWLSGIAVHDESTKPAGRDIIHITLKPKWKWFKPPLSLKIFKWEISFGWAYEIDKSYLLTNCRPAPSKKSPEKLTIEFDGSLAYQSKMIDELANKLVKAFDTAVLTDEHGNAMEITDDEMISVIKTRIDAIGQNDDTTMNELRDALMKGDRIIL